MKLEGKSQVLRIYIGSFDKHDHEPLYEFLIREAKKFGIAGASAFKGILSYGANSVLHSAKIWALSTDLPIIIEMIDTKEKISEFLEHFNEIFDGEDFGGLITTYEVEVITYKPHKNNNGETPSGNENFPDISTQV